MRVRLVRNRQVNALDSSARRAFEVLRRIDAERHAVDDGDVDAHAGLQRAQLLEPLALLERRGRQLDEALEGGAAVGIEPDVMVERPLPVGRGGAGEIERAQPGRRRPASRPTFTTFGLSRSSVADLGGERRDVDGRVGERPSAAG